MTATLQDHIARAMAVARVLRKHGADLEDLSDDVPKLIEIAGDLHDALKEQTIAESTAAARETAPSEHEVEAQARLAAPKITAKEAAAHITANGLTEAERRMFERASG